MKYLIIFLYLVTTALKMSAQNVWTDRSRLLPDQLRGIETAIFITHSPALVYTEINTTNNAW